MFTTQHLRHSRSRTTQNHSTTGLHWPFTEEFTFTSENNMDDASPTSSSGSKDFLSSITSTRQSPLSTMIGKVFPKTRSAHPTPFDRDVETASFGDTAPTDFDTSGPFGTETADLWTNIWDSLMNSSDPGGFFNDSDCFLGCNNITGNYTTGFENMTNITTTMASTLEPKYPIWVVVIFAALAGITSVTAILGNLLVIIAFVVERQIRQPSNYFICSLAVTDLIIGLFSMPLYTMYDLLGYWPLGPWICDLWLSLDYTVCLTSQYTVFFITLDRYCSVKLPAKYRNWRTDRKIIIMVAATWLVPTLVFFITIIGWQFFVNNRTVEADQCYVQFIDNPMFNCILVIGYYWVTLVVMCVFYGQIYHVAWSLQKKSEAKHKKMTSIVSAGKEMTKLGMGITANTTTSKPSVTSKYLTASTKFSTTSFSSKERAEEQSSSAYPSDSDERSSSPKNSPKPHQQNKDRTEQHRAMVPTVQIYACTPNGVSPTEYTSVSNNNINGSAQKTAFGFDSEKVNLLDKNSPSPSPSPCESSINSQNRYTFEAPDSPIWKRRGDFSEPPATLNERQSILPIEKNKTKPPSGGHQAVDTMSEHANGKTVTKVVEPKVNGNKRIRLDLNAVVHRITQAKLWKRKSEQKDQPKKSKSENRARKALRTITFILGAFVFFWTPYHVCVLIIGFCPQGVKCVPAVIYSVTYWFCYCNSPLNPFCYAAANQQFKKTFMRILKGDLHRT